jgi:hypothetical protein
MMRRLATIVEVTPPSIHFSWHSLNAATTPTLVSGRSLRTAISEDTDTDTNLLHMQPFYRLQQLPISRPDKMQPPRNTFDDDAVGRSSYQRRKSAGEMIMVDVMAVVVGKRMVLDHYDNIRPGGPPTPI